MTITRGRVQRLEKQSRKGEDNKFFLIHKMFDQELYHYEGKNYTDLEQLQKEHGIGENDLCIILGFYGDEEEFEVHMQQLSGLLDADKS